MCLSSINKAKFIASFETIRSDDLMLQRKNAFTGRNYGSSITLNLRLLILRRFFWQNHRRLRSGKCGKWLTLDHKIWNIRHVMRKLLEWTRHSWVQKKLFLLILKPIMRSWISLSFITPDCHQLRACHCSGFGSNSKNKKDVPDPNEA